MDPTKNINFKSGRLPTAFMLLLLLGLSQIQVCLSAAVAVAPVKRADQISQTPDYSTDVADRGGTTRKLNSPVNGQARPDEYLIPQDTADPDAVDESPVYDSDWESGVVDMSTLEQPKPAGPISRRGPPPDRQNSRTSSSGSIGSGSSSQRDRTSSTSSSSASRQPTSSSSQQRDRLQVPQPRGGTQSKTSRPDSGGRN